LVPLSNRARPNGGKKAGAFALTDTSWTAGARRIARIIEPPAPDF
jgi:hypothetical protein